MGAAAAQREVAPVTPQAPQDTARVAVHREDLVPIAKRHVIELLVLVEPDRVAVAVVVLVGVLDAGIWIVVVPQGPDLRYLAVRAQFDDPVAHHLDTLHVDRVVGEHPEGAVGVFHKIVVGTHDPVGLLHGAVESHAGQLAFVQRVHPRVQRCPGQQ